MDLLHQMTLLYAEDDESTQSYYYQYFKHNFKVTYLAKDGQQAFEIYESKKPDVVILDINMPVLSGLSVCQKIRQQDKNTKIILLTARSDKEALMEAVELGLCCYLEKPVTRSQLKHALKKISTSDCQENTVELWHEMPKSYIWDFIKQELNCNAEPIHLTKKEKQLFNLLIKSNGRTISYKYISQLLWQDDNVLDINIAAIKTLLKGLRCKLPAQAIKNNYGMGYYIKK